MSPTVEDVRRIAPVPVDAPDGWQLVPFAACCEVCGEERPRHLLMTTLHPMGEEFDLPAMAITRNVTHCRDRRDCLDRGEDPDEWPLGLIGWGDDLDREIRLKAEG